MRPSECQTNALPVRPPHLLQFFVCAAGVCSSVCSSQLGVAGCVLQVLQTLLPVLEEEVSNRAAVSSVNSARGALATLHSHPKVRGQRILDKIRVFFSFNGIVKKIALHGSSYSLQLGPRVLMYNIFLEIDHFFRIILYCIEKLWI